VRLQIVNSKNAASLYVVKSVFVNGRRSSNVVEKLGTYAELLKTLDGQDPIERAKKYVAELNQKEKEEKRGVLVILLQNKSQWMNSIPSTEIICFYSKFIMLLVATKFVR